MNTSSFLTSIQYDRFAIHHSNTVFCSYSSVFAESTNVFATHFFTVSKVFTIFFPHNNEVREFNGSFFNSFFNVVSTVINCGQCFRHVSVEPVSNTRNFVNFFQPLFSSFYTCVFYCVNSFNMFDLFARTYIVVIGFSSICNRFANNIVCINLLQEDRS